MGCCHGMSHLYQRPDSKLWWGIFTAPDGKRRRRSTGSENHEEAKQILAAWTREGERARKGVLIESRTRRVLSELIEDITGGPLHFARVRD